VDADTGPVVNNSWTWGPPTTAVSFEAFSAQDMMSYNSIGMNGGSFKASTHANVVDAGSYGHWGTPWDDVDLYTIPEQNP
jgi:hypothetical protein